MKLKLDIAKFDYLKAFWNREMEEYRHELIWSKNNSERVLLKQFENYKEEIAFRLLRLFLDRCKLRHTFAFV